MWNQCSSPTLESIVAIAARLLWPASEKKTSTILSNLSLLLAGRSFASAAIARARLAANSGLSPQCVLSSRNARVRMFVLAFARQNLRKLEGTAAQRESVATFQARPAIFEYTAA